jgi:YD repeat-containing protein
MCRAGGDSLVDGQTSPCSPAAVSCRGLAVGRVATTKLNDVRSRWDAAGRRTRLTVDGDDTVYGYDPAGRLSSVTHPQLGQTRYGYDADGLLVAEDLPGGDGRGYKRDRHGRVVGYTQTLDGHTATTGRERARTARLHPGRPAAVAVRRRRPHHPLHPRRDRQPHQRVGDRRRARRGHDDVRGTTRPANSVAQGEQTEVVVEHEHDEDGDRCTVRVDD